MTVGLTKVDLGELRRLIESGFLVHNGGLVVDPKWECPFCHARTLTNAFLKHLGDHGMVGLYSGSEYLRCACGFEGRRSEMVTHWHEGDKKHAALCVLGDLGAAGPYTTSGAYEWSEWPPLHGGQYGVQVKHTMVVKNSGAIRISMA